MLTKMLLDFLLEQFLLSALSLWYLDSRRAEEEA
jgi:hypothetical protein